MLNNYQKISNISTNQEAILEQKRNKKPFEEIHAGYYKSSPEAKMINLLVNADQGKRKLLKLLAKSFNNFQNQESKKIYKSIDSLIEKFLFQDIYDNFKISLDEDEDHKTYNAVIQDAEETYKEIFNLFNERKDEALKQNEAFNLITSKFYTADQVINDPSLNALKINEFEPPDSDSLNILRDKKIISNSLFLESLRQLGAFMSRSKLKLEGDAENKNIKFIDFFSDFLQNKASSLTEVLNKTNSDIDQKSWGLLIENLLNATSSAKQEIMDYSFNGEYFPKDESNARFNESLKGFFTDLMDLILDTRVQSELVDKTFLTDSSDFHEDKLQENIDKYFSDFRQDFRDQKDFNNFLLKSISEKAYELSNGIRAIQYEGPLGVALRTSFQVSLEDLLDPTTPKSTS
ncbi:MAG: hypothetical protein HRT47_06220 [Candidatus Caenarcaniphilales bacterium]|nr:hypothetical protein [Candidatus Caenarcaniphilales bacterium]